MAIKNTETSLRCSWSLHSLCIPGHLDRVFLWLDFLFFLLALNLLLFLLLLFQFFLSLFVFVIYFYQDNILFAIFHGVNTTKTL